MSGDSYDAGAKLWAQRMRDRDKPSHDFLEKPAMFAALPDLTSKRVLCIGCGSGEECRELKNRGAASVHGIDSSTGLIEIARSSFPNITFEARTMESIEYPSNSFDFAYSSLVLHYAQSWTDILSRIHASLTPGSEFLFSTHHPVRWGMEKSRIGDHFTYQLSYEMWGSTEAVIHGDYLTERSVSDTLLNEIPVTYWHRPLGSLLRDIIRSPFSLIDAIEPLPTDDAKAKKKNFWTVHQKIPQFIIFRLQA